MPETNTKNPFAFTLRKGIVYCQALTRSRPITESEDCRTNYHHLQLKPTVFLALILGFRYNHILGLPPAPTTLACSPLHPRIPAPAPTHRTTVLRKRAS